MAFCHCHLHGEFSFLDGCGKSTDYAARAVEIGQEAVALTDHENLCGALYHAEACYEKEVKPIIGLEAYFEPVGGSAKAAQSRAAHHLLLLAKNKEGFHNLMRLSSAGYEGDHFYYKAQIDWDLLARHSSGLIATSGCIMSYLPRAILGHDAVNDAPDEIVQRMLAIFGDDYFFEIQPHDITFEDGTKPQHIVNERLVEMSQAYGIPLLATADTHYPAQDWRTAQDTVLMMSTNMTFAKRAERDKDVTHKPFGYAYPTTWMMTEQEMKEHFLANHSIPVAAWEEAMANTSEVVSRCDDFSFDKSPKVPKAHVPADETAESVLIGWCREGMERIRKVGDETYEARLKREIDLFREKDVFDYFVIIGDLVREAKRRGIRVGPGRGSAGASLVLYLIGVTAMDPIGYDLLFERFMNEHRADMPDVDIDFQHDRRDELARYLIETYGEDKVSYVAAFQSFGMKSVIQAVARSYDLDFMEAKRASDALDDIPQGDVYTATLAGVVDAEGHEALAKWRDNHPDEWEIALKLENQMKGMSKHAAAVVVTDRPVRELLPTMRVVGLETLQGRSDGDTKSQDTVTQWSARANAELISTYGFLKIDLLATEGLTIQAHAIDLIKQRHGITIDFEDVETHPEVELPTGDLNVVERFGRGGNLGIFQFGGSSGISHALADIKPLTIDDLIAANAMYRPGPMGNLKVYAKRKNDIEEWSVPEQAESVLGRTFGIITYQEQVMQLFVTLAGLDPATADVARKVVGKGVARDVEGAAKLRELEQQWHAGCAARGVDKEYAEKLFGEVVQMATYSFNRAHSAGYALQAYQDQWIKTYYPLEFYAAVLSVDTDKQPQAIREARASMIEILPPDVNESDGGFTIVDDAIRFGLLGIANVGEVAYTAIRRLRPFGSLDEFDYRVAEEKAKRQLNAKVRTSLVGCGAFDYDGQRDEWTIEEKAEREKELLKFSPSQPDELAQYHEFLKKECSFDRLDDAEDGDIVNIVGEVTGIKKKKTKKGDPFAFVTLWYDGQDIETVFWSEQLARYEDILVPGKAIMIRGTWQAERYSLVTRQAESVSRLASLMAEEELYAR